MPYTLIHTSRNGRERRVEFSTLAQARVEAYRWRRSPKTLKVVLGYTPDDDEPLRGFAKLSSVVRPDYASSNPTASWFDTSVKWIDDKLFRRFRY